MKFQHIYHYIKHFKWILPYGLIRIKRNYLPANSQFYFFNRSLLKLNQRLYNRFRSKRCFILLNGPSVLKQDLSVLINETIFVVSKGYQHCKDLNTNLFFHCTPRLPPRNEFTEEEVLEHFQLIDQHLPPKAEIFLDYSEAKFVEQKNLFLNRIVHYVATEIEFDRKSTKIYDLTKQIPAVQTVPIMCLMIAMYLGFEKIYLLGADHDTFRTGEYKYAFKETWKGKDTSVDENGIMRDPLREELTNWGKTFTEYHLMHNIAKANGVRIYNATAGGALDEFERISLEEIFQKK
jgi:hypothetical protein